MLGFAVLGLLAAEPLSGYDIAARMRRPMGFFWSANHSQIYPMLARLLDAGMVKYRTVVQSDRPDKKIYELTKPGREALRAWVTGPITSAPVREELLVRAFLAPFGEESLAGAFYEKQADAAEQEALFFEGKLADYARPNGSAPASNTPEFGAYATLKYGCDVKRQIAGWCRWMAAAFEGGGKRPPKGGPRRA